LLLPLTSDGRRRGGGGRVSDAIVSGIYSRISGMNVYTIEDLEFMGIGRMINDSDSDSKKRGKRQTHSEPYLTRKQRSSRINSFH
jgi:hypothetical protein